MAWTAFPTWVVGQVSMASDWNTYVANNVQFLATPPLGRAYLANNQSVGTGSWGQVQLDTPAFVQGGVTFGTYAITVPDTGTYQVTGQCQLTSAAFSNSYCGIGVNSTTTPTRQWAGLGDSSGNFVGGLGGTALIRLNANDVLSLLYYSGSGTTVLAGTANTYLEALLVSI